MSAHHCMILELSDELLLHITSYCDAKSILLLAETCRTLNNLCGDGSVIQGAFFRKSSHGQKALPRGVLKKWIGSDRRVLERHLFALDRADDLVADAISGELLEQKRNIQIAEDRRTVHGCRYLPHLLISGCHPDLRYAATSWLRYITLKHLMLKSTRLPDNVPDIAEWPYVELLQWSEMSINLHSRIAFVFAVQSLPYESTDKDRFENQAEEHRDAFAMQVSEQLEDEFRYWDDLEFLAPNLGHQALLFKAVGVLALSVRTRSHPSQHGDRPKVPLANSKPWVNLGIEPPTPFWSGEFGGRRSWPRWLDNHNAAASQPEALNSSGEWIGIYETGRKRRACDPMMVNIHFQVNRLADLPGHAIDGPRIPNAMLIRAENCVDGVGRFNLSGQINSKTGQFTMTKHYAAGFSWPWEGAMTPFGFVGRWGHSRSPASGFFWLYKRSWREPSTNPQGHVS